MLNRLSLTGAVFDSTRQLTLLPIMANHIDAEIIAHLLSRHPRFNIIQPVCNLATAIVQSRSQSVDVLIVDPKCEANAVARTVEIVINGQVRRAVLLDDRTREGLVAAILPFAQISYLTRQSGSRSLIDAILRVACTDDRVFDASIAPRVQKTPRGWRLQHSVDRPSVAILTSREQEILKLLAEGRTVRDCAYQLHLSESTVDNHKTRLMRKLQLHKLSELTHMAIRDGLITV